MTERLPLTDILIPPERLRELDEEKAQLMAASVAQHGIFQPVAVYRSSAADRPYTLIFGLHRHRAAQIAGLEEVPVTIRTKAEAKALEIAENLFRNDLTTMERADFVAAWFEECGITPGRKSIATTLTQLFPGRDLSSRAAEELGLSGRKAQRLCQIGRDLHPELKELFRGTEIANNQAVMLKCARHGTDIQAKLVAAMREGASIQLALSYCKLPQPEADPVAKAMKRILADWKTLPPESRAIVAKKLGLDRHA